MPTALATVGPKAQRVPRALQVGGLTPFTSIDYPGQLAAVVFVQGCPWRCSYCHNPHLQPRHGASGPAWSEVLAWLGRRTGLLDAVVFSGGEPTADPALPTAVADVRRLGFRVGLHTAGIYPRRLEALLPLLDWVGLDIKAPLCDRAGHQRITGVRGGTLPVQHSLSALLAQQQRHGLTFECRTTAHPALLDDAALLSLGDGLADAGVLHWALQICRVPPGQPWPAVTADYPAAATLSRLQERLPGLSVRRA